MIKNIIKIDGMIYKITFEYINHYEIKSDNKFGLVDKKTKEIVLEPIYDFIYYPDNKYYEIEINDKFGLVDKKTGKVLLKPGHYLSSCDILSSIYEQKLLLQEKLKQLKEDLC